MHDHEPNQTFSKRYAKKIDDDQLPRDYDRRILVNSNGGCSISYHEKRAEDLLDYFIDMMQWLEPNEVVVGAAAWCDPESLIVTRLEYASTGVVAWLVGGGDDVRQCVNIQISTSLGKIKLVQFIVHTCGTATDLTFLTVKDAHATVGSNVEHPPAIDLKPIIKAYPSSIVFPITGAISGESSQNIIIKNDGDAVGYIRRIGMIGPFSQMNSGMQKLLPGEFIQIKVTFKPQKTGDYVGSMNIDAGEGLKEFVSLFGVSVSAHRITTKGNQFITTNGDSIRLKSVNWFGAETEVFTPHGLWARNYKEIIDQIKQMGFNSVRLPFSGDLCSEDRYPTTGVINIALNADLATLSAVQVLDKIISYMNEVQLYVILDHHRRVAGDGADGRPINNSYGVSDWKASWDFMIQRYADLDFVLGADIHNEPHELEWGVWAELAEDVGNHILSKAPHWIIFVEGVATHNNQTYWWGGELSGVASRPVKLSIDGRLAYSAHEYGQSVSPQAWLARDDYMPRNWPMNLYGVWRAHWGFIVEQNIAPVWLGEVGGRFGVDGNGVVESTDIAQYERQWIYHLQHYMAEHEVSFAYWAINPNSGDTGGLLQDDWTTEQSAKLGLIRMMLNNLEVPYVFGLTPLPWDELESASQVVIAQDGQDFAITVSDLTNKINNDTFQVGHVFFFATIIDPNQQLVGQTWVRVPGAEKTIRLSKEDDSDILSTGGSDKVDILQKNLPATRLSVTGSAESTDLGTKDTSNAGAHSHTYWKDNVPGATVPSAGGSGYGEDEVTSTSGAHAHTVDIGAHTHTVTGQTANMGEGEQLDVTNEYITLAAWYRIS